MVVIRCLLSGTAHGDSDAHHFVLAESHRRAAHYATALSRFETQDVASQVSVGRDVPYGAWITALQSPRHG